MLSKLNDILLVDDNSTLLVVLSEIFFARLFKNTVGVSSHEYVMMRRIERAKELLKRSSMSVLEIGVRVGYLDAKHFRNIFRREAGVSPMEFRSSQS